METRAKIMMVVTIFMVLLLTPIMFDSVLASPVPDTGQTKCYDNSQEMTTCPSPGEDFYGQDGNYDINTQSYTKLDENGDDLPDDATEWVMVRDNVTGLIWENKTDDGTIHDKDNTYNWYDAQDVFIATLNSQNFGGHNDWRLPTIKELSTIVDSSIPYPGPTINTNYFPNTQSSLYWSSTTYARYPDGAWIVHFYDGYIYYNYKSYYGYYVRAVRSGQCGSFGNFIDNGDGTVSDTDTGLMWQKDTPPGTYTWQQALSYCENLTLAGHNDWRLPNRNELQSIVDYSRSYLAIDPIFNTVSSNYWSSTTYASNPSLALSVLFYEGSFLDRSKSYFYNYVRAVRSGQCGSFGDLDDDCRIDCFDNCPSTPNGLDFGTCTKGTIAQSCTTNEQCGTGGFCSREQEDTDSDYLGDACDECTDTDKDGYGNPGFLLNTCPDDNCPSLPNGSGVGTCVKTEYGITHSYRVGDPKQFITCDGNEDCTPTGGTTCQMAQIDSNVNGCGDVCECYSDCNGTGGVPDGRVSTPDYSQLKIEFGRFDCAQNPCKADFNGDNRVSTPDYSILKQEFGRFDCPLCQ